MRSIGLCSLIVAGRVTAGGPRVSIVMVVRPAPTIGNPILSAAVVPAAVTVASCNERSTSLHAMMACARSTVRLAASARCATGQGAIPKRQIETDNHKRMA